MNPHEVISQVLLNSLAANEAHALADKIIHTLRRNGHDFAPVGWRQDVPKRPEPTAEAEQPKRAAQAR